jgi:hypothetical protein
LEQVVSGRHNNAFFQRPVVLLFYSTIVCDS